jgi:thioredoxin 1
MAKGCARNNGKNSIKKLKITPLTMAELEITNDNFEKEVVKSDLPVLLDFHAEWCGPCKMLGPVIDEVAKEFDGKWKVGKCDIDSNSELAGKFGIQSIPTLLFFKDGEVVETMMGFQSKENIVAKMG